MNTDFYNNLLRLKRRTGKRTNLIGINYGNNNILYSLKFLGEKKETNFDFKLGFNRRIIFGGQESFRNSQQWEKIG